MPISFPQLSGKLKKKPFGVQHSVADLLSKTNTAKVEEVLMGRENVSEIIVG